MRCRGSYPTRLGAWDVTWHVIYSSTWLKIKFFHSSFPSFPLYVEPGGFTNKNLAIISLKKNHWYILKMCVRIALDTRDRSMFVSPRQWWKTVQSVNSNAGLGSKGTDNFYQPRSSSSLLKVPASSMMHAQVCYVHGTNILKTAFYSLSGDSFLSPFPYLQLLVKFSHKDG